MSIRRRVVLIDDHTLVRAGLRALIDDLPDFAVVGEGDDGDQALTLIEQYRPDVLLMDISMPRMSGLDALDLVRRHYPALPVIMLSMHALREYALQALRAGAAAYLLKEAAETELELALRAAGAGEQYLSPKISSSVLDALPAQQKGESLPLTERQREVLRLLALGYATKEIAFELQLSAKTVESHRAQIMARLAIRDVAGLVLYAIRHGIISLDDGQR